MEYGGDGGIYEDEWSELWDVWQDRRREKNMNASLCFLETINNLQNSIHRKHRNAYIYIYIYYFFSFLKESGLPPWRFSTHRLALGASKRFSPMDLYFVFSFFFEEVWETMQFPITYTSPLIEFMNSTLDKGFL